jgi:hypothetical protein
MIHALAFNMRIYLYGIEMDRDSIQHSAMEFGYIFVFNIAYKFQQRNMEADINSVSYRYGARCKQPKQSFSPQLQLPSFPALFLVSKVCDFS